MITSSRCYFHEMTNVVVSWKRDCSWLLQNLNCFWKFYSNLQFIIFLITLTGSWLDACRRVKPRHYCQLFFFILIYLWDFFQVVVSTWDSFCVWVSKSAFITEVFSSFSCFFHWNKVMFTFLHSENFSEIRGGELVRLSSYWWWMITDWNYKAEPQTVTRLIVKGNLPLSLNLQRKTLIFCDGSLGFVMR